jgi:cation diffusion facilitator CzcD-associated flavoprotein CzcO
MHPRPAHTLTIKSSMFLSSVLASVSLALLNTPGMKQSNNSAAGVYMLKTLRERGLKTVIFEAGNDLGGTWRWNCYPGAAVDSDVPEYEYSWPEVYNTWSWRTNYPNFQDLRNYFDHVDKVMKIKKDCSFNTRVVGAHFSTDEGKWSVETADGRTTKTKYLVLGTGVVSLWFPD